MLTDSISALLNGWLPDSVILFFVALIVWKLTEKKLTRYVRKLGLIRSRPAEDRQTRQAREAMRDLQKETKPKGISRVWASFLLAILAGSWGLWAGTAVIDHERIATAQRQALDAVHLTFVNEFRARKEIAELKAELEKYQKPLTNVHTWFDVQVIKKTDRSHYLVHVRGRQLREAFFLCPDSAHDADWDEGMTLDSITFEMREGCKSIHDDSLGFYVHRVKNSTEFIRFTKEYE